MGITSSKADIPTAETVQKQEFIKKLDADCPFKVDAEDFKKDKKQDAGH